MAPSNLTLSKQIFGGNGPTLKLDGALDPALTSVDLSANLAGGKSFGALGGQMNFGGSGGAALELLPDIVDLSSATPVAGTEQLAPLGAYSPPTGKQWSVLSLHAGAKASASGSGGGAVTVNVSGSAKLGFRYRTVRAVPATDDLRTALPRVLETVRLPFSFDLESFRPNQWHEMSFDASLSVSASIAAGKTLELASNSGPLAGLLPENSPEVAARISVLARASLGLELLDTLRVGAGRLPAERSGWVRYRLERSKQRSISFGASLALELWYNKEILHRLLDVALAGAGYAEIQPKLLEIAENIDPDDLTLDNLKSRLSDELFNLAKDALPIDEVTGEIAERATGLLALVQQVQTAYTHLDGEYQGLVDHLLGSAGLSADKPLRQALRQLQGLGDLGADDLLDEFRGGLGDLEPLFDLLSATSINDLLLDGTTKLKSEVDRLAVGAGRVLNLLSTADNSDLTDVLEKVTGSGTVRRVVDLINGAPADLDSFRTFLEGKIQAETRLGTVLDRLVGGVAGKIPNKKLKRLRQWAEKVDGALSNAAAIDQRLKAEIDKIHDRVGFVVSFTIDRTTRRTTLIDVELDPKSQACRQAFKALADGKVDDFTEQLPFEQEPEDDTATEPSDPPFRFHHFVLASDRSTTLSWMVAPSMGAGKRQSTRAFDSSRIEITQSNGDVTRTGSYSGGLVQTTGAAKEGLLRSWMGSIWLTSEASAGDLLLNGPYTSAEHSIRLSTLRFDDDLNPGRRDGLDEMLDFLGFSPELFTSLVPPEATATRVAADLRLKVTGAGADPVDDLLAPLQKTLAELRKSATLDAAFLEAAQGWLSEPLVERRFGALQFNRLLPRVVSGPGYRERWRSGPWDQPFLVQNGAKVVRVRAAPAASGDLFAPVLRSLAGARSGGSKPAARLGRAWKRANPQAPGGVEPKALVELSRAFRRTVRKTSPGIALWSSPLFQHWLVFSQLRDNVEKSLLGLQGVASISWRIGDEDWQSTRRVLIV